MTITKKQRRRAALRAYPGSDLLSLEIDGDSLAEIVEGAAKGEFGDTLASFVVLELDEILEGQAAINAAISAIVVAIEDLPGVKKALISKLHRPRPRGWRRGPSRAQGG